MRTLCAWCNKDLGEKEPFEDNEISHGCCRECVEKIEKDLLSYQRKNENTLE